MNAAVANQKKTGGADVVKNDILKMLPTLGKGQFVGAVSDKLDAVVEEVLVTGKAGSVTITLGIEPDGLDENKEVSRIRVKPKLKAKLPDRFIADSQFFVSHGGALTRQNPEQIESPALGGGVE